VAAPAEVLSVVSGYDAAVIERFPGIRAGVVRATGLANGPSVPALRAAYRAEQAVAVARLAGTALADLPSIAAWRRAFSGSGVTPTQYRNAAEALLRRLTRHGDIPSINTLVDVGNLVSIRYAFPVAVCDQTMVVGGTTDRFATGEEWFTGIGTAAPVRPEPRGGDLRG
jgi:DNA/RNA-binding domain of Phe-tRNA-synthetase-like protein